MATPSEKVSFKVRLTLAFRLSILINPPAYDEVMKTMTITATVISVVPLLLSLFMSNYYLGDSQNAIDDANLAGGRGGEPDGEKHEHQ